MARRERLSNGGETTLNGAITNVATTLTVFDATTFPTEGDFRILIDSELILVTSVASNIFTIERGIESTTGVSHTTASTVVQILTQEGIRRLIVENVDTFAYERPPFRIQDTNGNLLTSSDFTTVHGTSLTIHDNPDGSITLEFPATATRLPMLVRTAPSTPYTITGAFRMSAIADDGNQGLIGGPIFRDSGGDDSVLYRYRPLANVAQILHARFYNNETEAGAPESPGQLRADNSVDAVKWFQMSSDGTNLIFRYSSDGVHFIEWFNSTRVSTGLLAEPDGLGFALHNPSAGNHIGFITLLAWDGE